MELDLKVKEMRFLPCFFRSNTLGMRATIWSELAGVDKAQAFRVLAIRSLWSGIGDGG